LTRLLRKDVSWRWTVDENTAQRSCSCQPSYAVSNKRGTMQSQSAADLSCSVCNQILHDNEDSIQCSGVCDISVHLKCSGLKKSEQQILQEGSGLLWFCDHCRIVGTNVSFFLMSIKSALLNCQDQLIKQSLMIETQNATIASLKSELSLVKTTLFSTRSAEDAAITSLVETTKKNDNSQFLLVFQRR
jgi:hypothetical protein